MKKLAIQIQTETHYLEDQSSADNYRYVWSYDITIKNESDEIIQLLNRYWHIVDAKGKVEEVRGPGVIGLQPLIKPGKEFAYSSFCQLPTANGSMEGHYEVQNLNEEKFIIEIPKFLLQSPTVGGHALRSMLH